MWKHGAPEPEPPAAHVVPDGGRRPGTHEHREEAPTGERHQRRGRVQQPERPPVAAVRALLLDAHLAALARSSPASHSAARRSPSDADARSKEASSRTTRSISSRRMARRQVRRQCSLAHASPIPIRSQRRGMGAEQQLREPGGSGSETLRTASSRSRAMCAARIPGEVERELVGARLHRARQRLRRDLEPERHDRDREHEGRQRRRARAWCSGRPGRRAARTARPGAA